VAEVGLERGGIVLGLEVSRLARGSTDWHRLLEICVLTETLILNEDGIYDPSNFNDRLLLGLKGTISEAELHGVDLLAHPRCRPPARYRNRTGDLAWQGVLPRFRRFRAGVGETGSMDDGPRQRAPELREGSRRTASCRSRGRGPHSHWRLPMSSSLQTILAASALVLLVGCDSLTEPKVQPPVDGAAVVASKGSPFQSRSFGIVIDHTGAGWAGEEGGPIGTTEVQVRESASNVRSLLLPAVQAAMNPADGAPWESTIRSRVELRIDGRGRVRVSGEMEGRIRPSPEDASSGEQSVLLWRGRISGSGVCVDDAGREENSCSRVLLRLEASGALFECTAWDSSDGGHNCSGTRRRVGEMSVLEMTSNFYQDRIANESYLWEFLPILRTGFYGRAEMSLLLPAVQ
jgi:hypothetical protein